MHNTSDGTILYVAVAIYPGVFIIFPTLVAEKEKKKNCSLGIKAALHPDRQRVF
jgi:hypothetical protein